MILQLEDPRGRWCTSRDPEAFTGLSEDLFIATDADGAPFEA